MEGNLFTGFNVNPVQGEVGRHSTLTIWVLGDIIPFPNLQIHHAVCHFSAEPYAHPALIRVFEGVIITSYNLRVNGTWEPGYDSVKRI